MDFTKFTSLLDKKSLFFSRSDKLGDPFEGSMSRVNVKQRASSYNDNMYKTLDELSKIRKNLRYQTFLNCWHINEVESDAMWKIYAKDNTGIAIQSTYKRLVDVLKENRSIYVGAVNYIDYDLDSMPETNLFWPFVHKQKIFKHESELRAIIQNTVINEKEPFKTQPLGVDIQINLDKLIEKIYVAPTSPKWFYDLVTSVIKKYNLTREITFSKLSDRPVY